MTTMPGVAGERRWLLAAAGLGALGGFCLARATGPRRSLSVEGEKEPKDRSDPKMKGKRKGRREIICEDALKWIDEMQSFPFGAMVFTSLPDMSEVVEFLGPRFEDWEQFFMKAVRQILAALPLNGVAVFYQTDVRLAEKGQVSKAFLVLKAAQEVPQVRLKWHKIVHFGTIDQPTWNAVQFTHLLCFAKGPQEVARVGCQGPDDEVVDLGSTIPDVLERGPKPSLRKGACCMGLNATMAVLKRATRRLPGLHTVIDPFCGAGTVLAVANEFGLDAIGVDISPRRIKQAQRLNAKDLRPKAPVER